MGAWDSVPGQPYHHVLGRIAVALEKLAELEEKKRRPYPPRVYGAIPEFNVALTEPGTVTHNGQSADLTIVRGEN